VEAGQRIPHPKRTKKAKSEDKKIGVVLHIRNTRTDLLAAMSVFEQIASLLSHDVESMKDDVVTDIKDA